MTELYIDKQLVVLPETFSITIIEENPFFTKNGKYTYDISLSLLDPINAKIYKHLNRLNRKGNIPKNRSAYLVVDNEVVLNGTELILEHTGNEVRIQLVSGNSELNFLIGGDRELRALDLGEADIYLQEGEGRQKKVFDDLQKTYPDRDYQFIPYCVGEEDVNLYPDRDHELLHIGNFSLLIQIHGWGHDSDLVPYFLPFRSGAVAQPYLCFIIKKVLESLGYQLEYNAIAEHPVLKNLYIVHGFRTVFFAKMLPSWTVTEFLDNIEKWLDCTFIVDSYNKTVKLMFNYQANNIK